MAQVDVRCVVIRMDRLYQTLATSRKSFTGIGRFKYAAGTVSAHGGIIRLRHLGGAGMAYYYLPALLRCGRHLLGFCNGANTAGGNAKSAEAGRIYYH